MPCELPPGNTDPAAEIICGLLYQQEWACCNGVDADCLGYLHPSESVLDIFNSKTPPMSRQRHCYVVYAVTVMLFLMCQEKLHWQSTWADVGHALEQMAVELESDMPDGQQAHFEDLLCASGLNLEEVAIAALRITSGRQAQRPSNSSAYAFPLLLFLLCGACGLAEYLSLPYLGAWLSAQAF